MNKNCKKLHSHWFALGEGLPTENSKMLSCRYQSPSSYNQLINGFSAWTALYCYSGVHLENVSILCHLVCQKRLLNGSPKSNIQYLVKHLPTWFSWFVLNYFLICLNRLFGFCIFEYRIDYVPSMFFSDLSRFT